MPRLACSLGPLPSLGAITEQGASQHSYLVISTAVRTGFKASQSTRTHVAVEERGKRHASEYETSNFWPGISNAKA